MYSVGRQLYSRYFFGLIMLRKASPSSRPSSNGRVRHPNRRDHASEFVAWNLRTTVRRSHGRDRLWFWCKSAARETLDEDLSLL